MAETKVSNLWNYSFTPLKLKFHAFGTKVSQREMMCTGFG